VVEKTMPIADTEFLFALNPKDKRHKDALKCLELKDLRITDVALLEFQTVLKARGRSNKDITSALIALKQIFENKRVKEVHTLNVKLLIKQMDIEERCKLSYFDSLIAASALVADGVIISDDLAFEKVPNLKRIALSKV